jgi:DNA polymerase-1
MARWVVDIECNGLLDTVSKIWCIVAKDIDKEDRYVLFSDECSSYDGTTVHSLRNFKRFVKQEVDWCIGHNILTYDLPVLDKLQGIRYNVLPDTWYQKPVTFIDTLVWSQHLFTSLQLPKGCPTTYKAILPNGSQETKVIGPHSLAAYGYRVGISKPEVEDWTDQPIGVYLNRCIEDTKINALVFNKYFKHYTDK